MSEKKRSYTGDFFFAVSSENVLTLFHHHSLPFFFWLVHFNPKNMFNSNSIMKTHVGLKIENP